MIVTHDIEKRFVGLQYPAVEIPNEDADDVGIHQPPNLGFALLQRSLSTFAFDELADLAADGSQYIEQLRIGLLDLAAEKLDYAQGLPPEQDGKTKGRA